MADDYPPNWSGRMTVIEKTYTYNDVWLCQGEEVIVVKENDLQAPDWCIVQTTASQEAPSRYVAVPNEVHTSSHLLRAKKC